MSSISKSAVSVKMGFNIRHPFSITSTTKGFYKNSNDCIIISSISIDLYTIFIILCDSLIAIASPDV